MASDLFGLNISLFDLAQSAMSPAQSKIFAENASTAAGDHEP